MGWPGCSIACYALSAHSPGSKRPTPEPPTKFSEVRLTHTESVTFSRETLDTVAGFPTARFRTDVSCRRSDAACRPLAHDHGSASAPHRVACEQPTSHGDYAPSGRERVHGSTIERTRHIGSTCAKEGGAACYSGPSPARTWPTADGGSRATIQRCHRDRQCRCRRRWLRARSKRRRSHRKESGGDGRDRRASTGRPDLGRRHHALGRPVAGPGGNASGY